MDEIADHGWIEALPAGWIESRVAARRLRALIEDRLTTDDLAPWLGEFSVDEYRQVVGGTEAEARHSIKLVDHLAAVFQRAILTGALSASSFDGHAFKSLPKAAFVHLSVTRNALQMGVMDLDPLWPDEWWPWSSKHWAVPKAEFEAWMASPEPVSLHDLPPEMASTYDGTVVPLTFREPSARARVSLSEAVSWIAFGIALEPTQFEMALHWERLENGDLQAVQRKVTQAIADLMAAGADGRIAFVGRHVESLWQKGATNEAIDPLKLDDYKAFIIGRDDLYYGHGLHRTYRAKNDSQLHSSERRDLFTEVKVSRDDLIRQFPRQKEADATTEGLPLAIAIGELTLPGENFDLHANVAVSPWWSLLQVVGWIMTNSPAYVAYVAELEGAAHDDIGTSVAFSAVITYIARSHCKCAAQSLPDNQRWEACTCTGDAGRALLEAIRVGAVTPTQQTHNGPKMVTFHDLAGVGQRPLCGDWLDVRPALQFSSAEVRATFPPAIVIKQPAVSMESTVPAESIVVSTGAAEVECRAWLAAAFAADPDHRRDKRSFRSDALIQFSGRLSARGFDHRVWPELARNAGRSGAGAKRKS